MDTDRIPSLQAVAMRIQGALGNGIDQQAWRPGEHWLDAAVRVLEERFEREAYIAALKAERWRGRLEGIAVGFGSGYAIGYYKGRLH